MRIVVLGADGYLGWPTALHPSARGHDVVAVDSLVRRRWDEECGTDTLVPIASMEARLARWLTVGGRNIEWHQFDLCDMSALERMIVATALDAVVHFAEQRRPLLDDQPTPRGGDPGQQQWALSTSSTVCATTHPTVT